MIICFDGKHLNSDRAIPGSFLKPSQSGQGVFETIRVKNSSPQYLSLHLARLEKGARFICTNLPCVNYESLVRKLLEKNSLTEKLARLKITVFPGEKRKTAHFCITVESYTPPDTKNYASGVKLLAARHPFCKSEVARIKSICRLPYSKLRERALGKGCFDCLLTDAEENILETTIGNIFIWDGKKFSIPPKDSNRLRGIMERMVVRSLRRSRFQVIEKDIKLRELDSRKGMFMTNSLIGVMPVKAIGRTVLRNIAEDPAVKELIGKFSP